MTTTVRPLLSRLLCFVQ